MTGEEIKRYAKKRGVSLWQVAEAFGYADTTFSRKLRKSFNDVESERLISIIDQLSKEDDTMPSPQPVKDCEGCLMIPIELLLSENWLGLKGKQKTMYIYMLLRSLKRPFSKEFTFSWHVVNKNNPHCVYPLYTNKKQFYDDISGLIENGFIECVEYNRYLSKANVYKLSDKWKETRRK